MKKIGLISLLIVFMMAIMAGCGGNSKQDPLSPPPPGSSYSFINASTPLDIEESGKDYNLSVQLIDGMFGLPGETIRMLPFDIDYGIVDPSEVETNYDGWAHFSYHSPDNIRDVNGQSITLQAVLIIYDNEDDNETVPVGSITQDFVLNFHFVPPTPEPPTPEPPVGSLYHLADQSPSTIVVEEGKYNDRVVTVLVLDDNNMGIGGKTVVVSTLDPKYGYFDWTSTRTNDGGEAAFIYNAPDDIASVAGTSTTFNLIYVENGVTADSLPITIEFVQP